MRWMIRNSVEVVVAIAILVLFATAAAVYGGSLCNEDNKTVLSFLNKHVPIPPAKIVSKREVYGLCEIILQIKGEFVPVYATDQFVLAGEMFRNRHPVTQEKIKKVQAGLFISMRSQIDKVVAMTYKPVMLSKVQHTMYMFTDPVCPYCHLAEVGIRQLLKEHNTVLKVVFFPVHLPEGKEKAIEAVCRKLDFQAYIKDDWRKEKKMQYQCEEGERLVEKSIVVARKLGIRAVPTFYLDNGKRVTGANKGLIEKIFSD